MIKGGVGGANTKTGLAFELKTDLPTFIAKQNGYEIFENDFDIERKNGKVTKKKRKKVSRWSVTY